MRGLSSVALLCSVAACAAGQSLGSRVASSNGLVQVVYPSRGTVCGDGYSYIGHLFGESSSYYASDSWIHGNGAWDRRPCTRGPARLVATVIDGEITRLRVYVGPVQNYTDARTISVSADEASAWLGSLIQSGTPNLAKDAMLPLIVSDAQADPWPVLLRVARDDSRPLTTRRNALSWLGMGVNEKLGLYDERPRTDDDEIREAAVFALSQRPKSESVPELVDIARNGKHPSARKSAIFWLGQTGDMRAADVYAELLKIR